MSDDLATAVETKTCGKLSPGLDPRPCELPAGHDGSFCSASLGDEMRRSWPCLRRWVFAFVCGACRVALHDLPTFEASARDLQALVAAGQVPIGWGCRCLSGRPSSLAMVSVEVDEFGQQIIPEVPATAADARVAELRRSVLQ